MPPPPATSATHRRHVLVLITEDWFAVSHFLPLLRAMVEIGLEVTVATRGSGKEHLIEATGARVEPFDYKRGGVRPHADVGVVLGLRGLLRRLKPDAIHAIAMKPIALGALVAATGSGIPLVIHLTGVGLAGTASSAHTRFVHETVMRLIGAKLRRADVRLLVENPDDRARFALPGQAEFARIVLLGGAGLDPDRFAELPMPPAPPVRLGYVGRMIWSKGVDVLVAAYDRLRADGIEIELSLSGTPDPENPRSVDAATLADWGARQGVTWRGFVTDVREVWETAHVAVVPSRGGEGLPKALLEAAACGRPVIATDVPGCRYFVRDGVEGLIVPPDDAGALATAIRRLVADGPLRVRMGQAARDRLLSGFTERHLQGAVQDLYRSLLQLSPT